MTWFLIALGAPFLWAMVNHIDKYLIVRYGTGTGIRGLITFSALFSVLFLPVIYLTHPNVLEVANTHKALLILSGCLYSTAILFYLYGLNEGETSSVMPVFQLIPVFGYMLGFVILKEHLSFLQLIASLIIMIGAIMFSVNINKGHYRFNGKIFCYIAISSFIFALYEILFKAAALGETFWISSFWQYCGIFLTGVFFFSLKGFRTEFLTVFNKGKRAVFSLNILIEILTVGGNLLINYALMLAPAAMVLLVESFQPFFVFILGIVLTLFIPSWGKENLSTPNLLKKICGILIMFIGGYLLFFP